MSMHVCDDGANDTVLLKCVRERYYLNVCVNDIVWPLLVFSHPSSNFVCALSVLTVRHQYLLYSDIA